MPYTVRPILASELEQWVAASHVAFHINRPADAEARYRREVRHQDLSRSLAALDDNGRVVGTYYSFPAELTLPGGGCIPTNAVTAVAVLPTEHRRGLLRRMLTTDMHAAKERGDAASILIAAEYPIYGRFGFGPATEHATYRLETAHADFTRQATGRVELVSPETMREHAPRIFDDFRKTYPGQIDRQPVRWDTRLGLSPAPWRDPNEVLRCALYTPPGAAEPTGYVTYSVKGEWRSHVPCGRLEIDELIALDGEAYLALWRYCAEVDLVAEVTAEMRRVSEPLVWLLRDPRKAFQQTARADMLWARTLDTPRVLAGRRYASEARLVFEVDDPLGLAGGRFVLEGGPDGGICHATQASAELRMSMTALGAMCLGGNELHALATAGVVEEEVPGAVSKAARLFKWPIAPWCSTFF
jgi:predicted acetyltransferase